MTLLPVVDPLILGIAAAALVLVAAGVALARRRRARHDVGGADLQPPAPSDNVLFVPFDPSDPTEPPVPGRRRGWGVGKAVLVAILALATLTAAGLAARPWWPAWSSSSAEREVDPVALRYVAREGPRPGVRDAGSVEVSVAEGLREVEDPATGERMIVWGGDDQEGVPGRLLRRALTVVLRDAEGRPLQGRTVVFRVASGGGRVEPDSVTTRSSGLALVRWWPGSDPDSLRVTATVADRPGLSVVFTATLDPSAPAAPAAPVATAADDGESVDEEGPAPAVAEAAPSLRVTIPAPASWSAGGVHTCRTSEPLGLACWGGSAGAGGQAPDLSDGSVSWMVAGVSDACAVMDDGAIACWPVAAGGGSRAAAVRLPSGRPVQIAPGARHVCALSSDGAVYCWGADDRGQLGGDGPASDPIRVSGLPPAVRIASGWLHSCALTAAGQAYCWGDNASGQLGDGTTSARTTAAAVDQPAPFAAIAAGAGHTCALTARGDAWCWGRNGNGQLGTGASADVAVPVPVASEVAFAALTAGGVHTCGLSRRNSAWCWGGNTFGQLGNGTTADAMAPTPVRGDPRFTRLDAGGAHTCGEASDGGLLCWGNNIQGQLGDGTRQNRLEPARVRR